MPSAASQHGVSSVSSLITLEALVPAALDVYLILDNYGTHKTHTVRHWLAARLRFHAHFTPTSAS